MRLLPNMRLIMKAKIDHTSKPQRLFGSTKDTLLLCSNKVSLVARRRYYSVVIR